MEKTLEDYKELIDKLESEGNHYYEYTVVPGKGLCALGSFAFTVGLIVNIGTHNYEERYCYPIGNVVDALLALKSWDGQGYPSGNWIKRKGYIEETNPNYKE